MYIIDASALLAFLRKEPGYKKVKELFQNAYQGAGSVFIHRVNYTEALHKTFTSLEEIQTLSIMSQLTSPFFAVSNYIDDGIGNFAALLEKHYPVSMGDAYGLAFTRYMEGTFYTADMELKRVADQEQIPLELIR